MPGHPLQPMQPESLSDPSTSGLFKNTPGEWKMQRGPRLIGLGPQLSTCMDVERSTPETKRGLSLPQSPCPVLSPGMCLGQAGSPACSSPSPIRHPPTAPCHPPAEVWPGTQALPQAACTPGSFMVPSLCRFLFLECPAGLFLSSWPTPPIPSQGPAHMHLLSGACPGPLSRAGHPILHHLMAKTQGQQFISARERARGLLAPLTASLVLVHVRWWCLAQRGTW